MKTKAFVLLLLTAIAGCARTPQRSRGLPMSGEERLQETLEASEQGPSQWSPLVTIPLSPVLLVVDTSIKWGAATIRYIRGIFGGSDEPAPVPERVERQAEKIPKN